MVHKKKWFAVVLVLSILLNFTFAFLYWSAQKEKCTDIFDDFKRQLIRLRDASQNREDVIGLKTELAVMRGLNGRIYDANLKPEAEALQEMWIAYQYFIDENGIETFSQLEEDFNSMVTIADRFERVNGRKPLQDALSEVLLKSTKVKSIEDTMKESTFFRNQ